MSEKRKDNRGRILRTGESQRKDGTYQYRYADIFGTRRYIYDADLHKLREKEKDVQKQLDQGLDYANGKMTVVDWAHATQGNASADAAMTYLLFALKDQKVADLYLKLFCKKSDTAMQYVQQWLPIVAAAQLSKENELEKDFLMRWIDVVDYQ